MGASLPCDGGGDDLKALTQSLSWRTSSMRWVWSTARAPAWPSSGRRQFVLTRARATAWLRPGARLAPLARALRCPGHRRGAAGPSFSLLIYPLQTASARSRQGSIARRGTAQSGRRAAVHVLSAAEVSACVVLVAAATNCEAAAGEGARAHPVRSVWQGRRPRKKSDST